FSDPVIAADGNVSVTVSGALPVGSGAITSAFPVPAPTRFAQTVLREALAAAGIKISARKHATPPDFTSYGPLYTAENQLAEHVSPPLGEEIKLTLKVSQNLHAGIGPYLLGALVAKNSKDPLSAGFTLERSFLQSAKLDLSQISQGDGAGGDWAD